MILQRDVPLRIRNSTYTLVRTNFDRRSLSTYCCYRELAYCHVGSWSSGEKTTALTERV